MSTEQQTAPQQEEESNGWRPNPGDRVVGKIVDIAFTDMGYGEYPILTIQTESGPEVAVHGFHTVLKSEIFSHEPQPGEPVDITYLGKKTDGGGYGKGYDNYRVRWQSGGQVNWGSRKGQPQQQRNDDPPIEPSPPPPAEQPAAPAGSQFGDEPPF